MMVIQKNHHHELDKSEEGWAGRNGEELLDNYERAVKDMNLLPQALDFQGILFGHPSRSLMGLHSFQNRISGLTTKPAGEHVEMITTNRREG
jgi:hypothetical protein